MRSRRATTCSTRCCRRGLDRYWRRRAIRVAAASPAARRCSTSAPAPAMSRSPRRARTRGARRVSGRRLRRRDAARGLEKTRRRGAGSRASTWCAATRCSCRCRTRRVDGVTIAFGIRNVAAAGRRLSPSCCACCGRADAWRFSSSGCRSLPAVRPLYLWYFRHVLPRIGRAVSRHDAAYSYLPASVGAFPWGEAFADILREAGFNNVKSRPLTFGIVYLYTASKGLVGLVGRGRSGRSGDRRAISLAEL